MPIDSMRLARFTVSIGAGKTFSNNAWFSRFLYQRVVTEAARDALAGVEGEGEIIDYRGIPTLASWGPLVIPGTKWALIAKNDTSEGFASIYRLDKDLMIEWRRYDQQKVHISPKSPLSMATRSTPM